MISSLDKKIMLTEWREMEVNKKRRFCLRISNEIGKVDEVKLVIYKYHESRRIEVLLQEEKKNKSKDRKVFLSEGVSFESSGLYFYCLSLKIEGKQKYIKADSNWKPVITEEDLPYWQFTITKRKFEVPNWAKGAIMMQIFIDRFSRDKDYSVFEMPRRTIHQKWNELPVWKPNKNGEITNTDFFCGNLRGVINHLDYIKNLNVDIIYLSPILRSQSNHRYDTGNYEEIDPYVGTIEDIKELCKKAHALGMHIILDTVLNHTGNDSRYFNEYGAYDETGAFQGDHSKYYDWYKKNSEGKFCYWWGFKNLPVCDAQNNEWRSYLFSKGGIIDQWFSWGIDGLRIDVADELPENFLEELRRAVKRNKKDAYILGEVWENAMRKEKEGNVRTYLHGVALDSVMNYPFTNAILKYMRFGDFHCFKNTIDEIVYDYPKQALLSTMNSLSTHDIPRAITTLVGEGIEYNQYQWTWDIGDKKREWQAERDSLSNEKYELGKKMFRIATLTQYFLPGNPCTYYGDEVGLYGYKDPFNRKTYPWGREDFTLLEHFIQLGRIRKKIPILKKAKYRLLFINEKMLAFERYWKKARVVVIINRTNEILTIPNLTNNMKLIYSIENSTKDNLKPYGGIILLNC